MDFYRKRLVKKPRGKYKCHLCLQPIEGEHLYVSVKADDFWTDREHVECNKKAEQMCSSCDYSCGCTCSLSECFQEMERHQLSTRKDA